MNKLLITMLTCCMFFTTSCSGQQSSDETEVLLETTAGDIRIKLYNDTPRHRDNFLNNVRNGLYDGVTFHRIVRNFMIQTGDPDTRPGEVKDTTKVKPTIEEEIMFPRHFHKRGVVAAAREDEDKNPRWASDGFEFFIVTGKIPSDEDMRGYEAARQQQATARLFEKKTMAHKDELDAMRARKDRDGVSDMLEKLQDEARSEAEEGKGFRADGKSLSKPFEFPYEVKTSYRRYGGAPWLDNEYTIFGEVVEGMKVVMTIEKIKTNDNEQPLAEVRIKKATILNENK